MAQKLYKRIGLRRDRNLSDLGNATDSLNNLLNPLAEISEDATFISDDLNCIRGISNIGITPTNYISIADLTIEQTNLSGIDEVVRPIQTLKNRIDILEITAGDPRLNGGPGLFPQYYSSVNGDGYTDGNLVVGSGEELEPGEKNDFEWLSGNFEFNGKIRDKEVSNKGALVWEGFFVPTESGVHRIRITSDGYYRLDFQDISYTGVGINTYSTLIKSGITTTITANGNATTNVISNISDSDKILVGTGFTVSGPNIAADSFIDNREGNNSFILNPDAVTSNFTGGTLTLFKDQLGVLQTSQSSLTFPLSAYEKYYFKLTYFIPNSFTEEQSDINHSLALSLTTPGGGGAIVFPYTYLYPLDYDFSSFASGSFDEFAQQNLPKFGGSIGSTETSANYVSVETSSKIIVNYTPPSSVSDSKNRTISNVGLSTVTGVLQFGNTDGIEIGNYVFSIGGSEVPDGTRVETIFRNDSVVLDTLPTGNVTRTLEFFNHRGFVKKVTGSISGTTLTISSGDTDTLKTGMLVIGDGVTQYTGITTSNTQVTVSPSQTVAETTLYFYQSKGLINESLTAFCPVAETRCLITNGIQETDSTQLTVVSTAGASTGWYVYGSQFVNGTTITVNDPTTITLSDATINALGDGANFTVSSSTEEQKTLCCPPTDTSPPFDATSEGIDTPSSFQSLNLAGTISFESLSVGVSTVASIYSGSGNDSGSFLTIGTPIGNYDILCA
tara:strand:+ start:288 stop:2471 length:2184 start_codon:yes stop_codon:yes gene_type:complete